LEFLTSQHIISGSWIEICTESNNIIVAKLFAVHLKEYGLEEIKKNEFSTLPFLLIPPSIYYYLFHANSPLPHSESNNSAALQIVRIRKYMPYYPTPLSSISTHMHSSSTPTTLIHSIHSSLLDTFPTAQKIIVSRIATPLSTRIEK